MHLLPALPLAEIPEWAIGLGIIFIIGALNAVRIKRRMRTPAELPAEHQAALDRFLPGFTASGCFLGAKTNSYHMPGHLDGEEVVATVEIRMGRVEEIEVKAAGRKPVSWENSGCQPAELPAPVQTRIQQLAGTHAAQLEIQRCRRGRRGSDTLWDIDALSPGWEWEFKLTHEGRVDKVEIESR